jgi:hypothetical protein
MGGSAMSKLIGPKGMRELSVKTKDGERVLKAGKDGMFNVSDPKLARQLKKEGLGLASTGGVAHTDGFPCKKCGFGSFFKKCSKCGEING